MRGGDGVGLLALITHARHRHPARPRLRRHARSGVGGGTVALHPVAPVRVAELENPLEIAPCWRVKRPPGVFRRLVGGGRKGGEREEEAKGCARGCRRVQARAGACRRGCRPRRLRAALLLRAISHDVYQEDKEG